MSWFIKTFQKHKAIIVRIATQDHLEKSYWVIPKGKTVNIKGIGTFELNEKDFFYNSNRVPIYYFNDNFIQPIDMVKGTPSEYTPQHYQTAIDARMAEQIFSATGSRMNLGLLGLVLSFLTLIGLGLVYYMLQDQINQILDILRLIGGIQ